MSQDPLLEPRREFLSMAGAGALALATGGATTRHIATVSPSAPDPWLGPLTGKHKMYFDATSAAGGWVLVYVMNWLATAPATYGERESDFSAVIGARHFSAVMALNDSIWAKYPIGAMVSVTDPQTKVAAKRNIFFRSQPGDLMFADAAIDKLQARGTIMVACSVALGVVAGMAGAPVGVPADQAKAEFMANLLPGVKPVPSGVFAVAHAHEKGCAYCYAG